MRLTSCRAATVAFVSLALLALAGPAAATPTPGAAGIGDRLNPELGNGGYDVLHYDLDLRYATSDPAQSLDGDETILARATQSLSRFNLDFARRRASVACGSTARRPRFTRDGEELVDHPAPSRYGTASLRREDHRLHGDPDAPGDDPTSTAFFTTPDGSATAPQPYYAHLVYPCNDHPRDKATFTFDVRRARGHGCGRERRRGRATAPATDARTWTYVCASRWPPS